MAVIRAILFSFFFHFMLILGLAWLAPKFSPPEPEVIEVVLSPEQEILKALLPKEKSIVRQVPIPEKMKLPEDQSLARFLSDKTQRVRQESQAAQTGMTQNRSNQEAAPIRPQTKTSASSSADSPEKDGYRQVDISKELAEMRNFGDGFSSVGESLPHDVKVGSFTALNTDRYLFYTFYARVEELIRFRWENHVQQAINSLGRLEKINSSNKSWVTQAEFILDKNGHLTSALIMKGSGIPSFDLAAVKAFKDARIFPNPPSEMIKEDGQIHLVFSFTVRFNPPTLVNRN